MAENIENNQQLNKHSVLRHIVIIVTVVLAVAALVSSIPLLIIYREIGASFIASILLLFGVLGLGTSYGLWRKTQ